MSTRSQGVASLADGFSALDRELAALVARLAKDDPAGPTLTLSGALVSRERGRGNSCLELAGEAGKIFELAGERVQLPKLSEWRNQLKSSSLVICRPSSLSRPGETTPHPFVLDDSDRLYLWRYWQAEQRVARRLQAIASSAMAVEPAMEVADLWRRLFQGATPESRGGEVDWQAAAAATALISPLTLVSGGPGTGKTTTVVRILALLRTRSPQCRLALAAPTGKAAARLEEAIVKQLHELGDDVADRVGEVHAQTLHRLLGYSPQRDRFKRHGKSPLSCDVLVIDEASMVDLLMMDSLLDALPEGAQLILLGDRDQLASVDTGFVFGDLCTVAGLGLTPSLPAEGTPLPSSAPELAPRQRQIYELLVGSEIAGTVEGPPSPEVAHTRRALENCGVELQISYRFRDRPGIGALATALRRCDGEGALAVLGDPAHGEVRRHDPPTPPSLALEPIHAALDTYLQSDSPADALAALETFRILCPTRGGRWGMRRMNELVETYLLRSGIVDPSSLQAGFYRGRPILIEANDYSSQLFNGDLGVCWADEQDRQLWVFFQSPRGLRRFALAKLPRHSTAWAMTVHKSQGTELDHVLLILGEEDPAGLISRELLYTGVTRARHAVDLISSGDLLREAAQRSHRRTTGLADALGVKPAGRLSPGDQSGDPAATP